VEEDDGPTSTASFDVYAHGRDDNEARKSEPAQGGGPLQFFASSSSINRLNDANG
jgi:hypothetical protein